jgi:protein gp37
MADSSIEWTDAVWNPVRGCTRVSAGCQRCYAERTAHRFSGPGQPYEGLVKLVGDEPRWTGKIQLVPEKLREPLSWKKPRRVFVNSMSDLFHEGVPDEFIDRVFAVMTLAGRHTFQVLTKRPERMRSYLDRLSEMQNHGLEFWSHTAFSQALMRVSRDNRAPLWPNAKLAVVDNWPLKNLWLGVSVENQATADERIPHLLATPAAVRFLSCEPLLGPVRLHGWCRTCKGFVGTMGAKCHDDTVWPDWVIAGGESGPGARPCRVEWLRSLRDQCAGAGVAYFCKQLGSNPVGDDFPEERDPETGNRVLPVRQVLTIRDHKGGDIDEFPDDLRIREFPEVRV